MLWRRPSRRHSCCVAQPVCCQPSVLFASSTQLREYRPLPLMLSTTALIAAMSADMDAAAGVPSFVLTAVTFVFTAVTDAAVLLSDVCSAAMSPDTDAVAGVPSFVFTAVAV